MRNIASEVAACELEKAKLDAQAQEHYKALAILHDKLFVVHNKIVKLKEEQRLERLKAKVNGP